MNHTKTSQGTENKSCQRQSQKHKIIINQKISSEISVKMEPCRGHSVMFSLLKILFVPFIIVLVKQEQIEGASSNIKQETGESCAVLHVNLDSY